MPYKYTVLFQINTNPSGTAKGVRIAGWSESVYADSIDLTKFRNFQQIRALLLPSSGQVIGQRIQAVFPRGRAQATGSVFRPTIGSETDQPSTALLYSIRASGANNVRRGTIRGIPDANVQEGEYKPVNGYNYGVSAYLAELGNGFWKFPGRDLTVQPSPLVSVSEDGLATFSDVSGLAPGDRIRITGAEDPFGNTYGGTFKVLTVPTTVTARLNGWKSGAVEGGTWLDVTAKTLYAMDASTAEILRSVTKKVGRPFGGYRGRASKRKR